MKPYDSKGIAYTITSEVFKRMTEQPMFDGETFEAERDGKRLGSQLERVRDAMRDGQWWTLIDLAMECGGSEASVSARLRDLRKPKFGNHIIERQYVKDGLWQYRMVARSEGADGAGA